MKTINQAMRYMLLCTLTTLLFISGTHAQPAGTTNFYPNIKVYDLAALWQSDKLLLLSLNKYEPFPQPLGIIGKNYQRFYIHYTSVIKVAGNPYQYKVQGKTRVGTQVRPFTGTIKILQAGIYNPGDAYSPETYKGYKRGQMICNLTINEDHKVPGSGIITGNLTTNFCLNAKNQLLYDTLDFGIDGYGNNQFSGNWIANGSKQSQKLQFGDITIYDSPFSDSDGITVPPQYEKYGWQNYVNAISNDNRQASKAAITEEKRQWWK